MCLKVRINSGQMTVLLVPAEQTSSDRACGDLLIHGAKSHSLLLLGDVRIASATLIRFKLGT